MESLVILSVNTVCCAQGMVVVVGGFRNLFQANVIMGPPEGVIPPGFSPPFRPSRGQWSPRGVLDPEGEPLPHISARVDREERQGGEGEPERPFSACAWSA